MSSKRVSPAAKLLRQSRLFSLPSPLPRSATSTSTHPSILASTADNVSDTATLPHPVKQAIATPASSNARGDWGLKRSLPLKSTTRTSTPTVRINALDTQEHITDFDSAADLHLTGEKFRELGLPLTVPGKDPGLGSRETVKSAFEPHAHYTDIDKARARIAAGQQTGRWKFDGPWLAGLTQGEFLAYVGVALRGKKRQFLTFVREKEDRRLRDSLEARKTAAGRLGQTVDGSDTLTEAQFEEHLRRLRTGFDVKSDLAGLLSEFLDLPGVPSTSEHAADGMKAINAKGPPATHPSAGLSYLRSDAVLANHPVLGPLARPPPQQARVLSENHQFGGALRRGHLGVAGFVAPDNIRPQNRVPVEAHRDIEAKSKHDTFANKEASAQTMGIATEGGNRIWVEPTQAQLDERGQVQLALYPADASQVAGHHNNGEHLGNPFLAEVNPRRRPDTKPLPVGEGSHFANWQQELKSKQGGSFEGFSSGYGIDQSSTPGEANQISSS